MEVRLLRLLATGFLLAGGAHIHRYGKAIHKDSSGDYQAIQFMGKAWWVAAFLYLLVVFWDTCMWVHDRRYKAMIHVWETKPVKRVELEAIKWDGTDPTYLLIEAWGAPIRGEEEHVLRTFEGERIRRSGYLELQVSPVQGNETKPRPIWVPVPVGYYVCRQNIGGENESPTYKYFEVDSSQLEEGFDKVGWKCPHCEYALLLPGSSTGDYIRVRGLDGFGVRPIMMTPDDYANNYCPICHKFAEDLPASLLLTSQNEANA